jgi:hypothetical protein
MPSPLADGVAGVTGADERGFQGSEGEEGPTEILRGRVERESRAAVDASLGNGSESLRATTCSMLTSATL